MTTLNEFWRSYAEKSYLHGLRYIVNMETSPLERLMWILLVTVASISILVCFHAPLETFSHSAMQIVVDDPRYPLSKIDFPAVTICSTNKILYSKAKQFIFNKYEKDPELKARYENALYILGMLQYPTYKDLANFVTKNSMINLPLDNIGDLMLKLMPTIDEMFSSCYWRGTGFNCSDLIRLQRTEEGFCYSFNSKTSERTQSSGENNPPMAGPNGVLTPLRNNAAGKMTGFEVIMKSLVKEYFPLNNRSKGFNVMIHTPEDFPDISNSYRLYSELNQSFRISISVNHIRADKSFYRINEEDRKCFKYKRIGIRKNNLPSYKSNAVDNCYSRCRLEITYSICNCTPYYFKMKDDENKQYCGIEHIPCLGKINVLLHNTQAPEKEPGFPKWSIPDFMNCSCPNPCSYIGYTTEFRTFAKDFIDHTKYPSAYMHIDVHYKDRFAISYQRSVKYTIQDLLDTLVGRPFVKHRDLENGKFKKEGLTKTLRFKRKMDNFANFLLITLFYSTYIYFISA